MFPFLFVKKYLTPHRKQRSASFVALLSVGVIALVVWLVLLFLSISQGMEKTWLDRLTSLSAPLKIRPTEGYFRSYYHQIDRYSKASYYLSKTLGQKALALCTDPYDPTQDEELPRFMPPPDITHEGVPKDPVKELIKVIEEVSLSLTPLHYQEIQTGGALLKLDVIRQEGDALSPIESHTSLAQATFVSSLPDQNPYLHTLLQPKDPTDLHQLLAHPRCFPLVQEMLNSYRFEEVVSLEGLYPFPLHLLPEKKRFALLPSSEIDPPSSWYLIDAPSSNSPFFLERVGDLCTIYRVSEKGSITAYRELPLPCRSSIFSPTPLSFTVSSVTSSDLSSSLLFHLQGVCQGHKLSGTLSSNEVRVTKMTRKREREPLTLPDIDHHRAILVPKHFKEAGASIGDRGSLTYAISTPLGNQEMRIPVYIYQFYDPGLMPVGNKSIFVPKDVASTLCRAEHPLSLDRGEANQFLLWCSDLKQVHVIKKMIQEKLDQRGVSPYFHIETFKEYPFAKEIFAQFQSDTYLLTLVGLILLLVAATNIVSFLLVLVSSKKKEIAILRTMGASKGDIIVLFTTCGAVLGIISALVGVSLAYLTLHHLDSLIHMLSFLQGNQAFNPKLFGTTIAHAMSPQAMWFGLLGAPLLCSLAALIPALKAASISPCFILRSE